LLSGVPAVTPLAARAQGAVRLVAVMVAAIAGDAESQATTGAQLGAFRDQLAKLGWVVGRNLKIETRQSNDDVSALQASARTLVALRPDVLVVYSPPGLAAAMQATRTIPVVFHTVPDPVGSGFVASLAHPGGNATGFTNFEPSMAGKWIELLKEIAPGIKTVAMLLNPSVHSHQEFRAAAETAAATLGVAPISTTVTDPSEIGPAIDGLAGKEGCALVVFPSNIVVANETLVISHAARQQLPAIYPADFFVTGGGLISYGPDESEQFRGAATYVARILNGESPANLPVQAPTKFELAINLKTAKTLGLTVPQTLLVSAQQVIE
jgi:putative ABC transport system substrate-binding protein